MQLSDILDADAPRNKKGGIKFLAMINATANRKVLILANCNKLQSFSDNRQSPAVVYAAEA